MTQYPLPLPRPEDKSPLLQETLSPWRMYFSLQGRVGRRGYWISGVVILLVLGLVLTALLRIAGLSSERAEGVVNLLLAWPAIAVSVKRWHDRDRPGWWVLVNMLPVIGWLWGLLDNGFVPGSRSANRYGEPERAPQGLL
jgi:uncharacterized membrane protein YhaH (DUF805 family)